MNHWRRCDDVQYIYEGGNAKTIVIQFASLTKPKQATCIAYVV